ncbi:uncharacterized protein [Nicotiana tomentosiformis]|uniref:uncharacterized protein n=1 Tax=Nicotiana tomentosiformis TaxID=4098 RepID=UPI00388C9D82
MVLKLDMAKAYDRVSWPYLCNLMRRMGFNEVWIDIIFTHVSSNWYSLLVNGNRQGFFHSKRGLRQGDPIQISWFPSVKRIKEITGMEHKEFPIKYLGCPLYVSRKQIAIFSELVTKVLQKISGWHAKLLSTGGRAILIRHVLFDLSIQMMRTRTRGSDDQAPAPPARAARGRGWSRGRPRGAARAPVRAATEDPPAAPAGG